MVDKTLNYGRDVLRGFYENVGPYQRALDIGAGTGKDLLNVKAACPQAELYGVEAWPPSVAMLKEQGVNVCGTDIERDVLPFPDDFFDLVTTNQTLEHVKEIFWIFHNVSRVLRVGGYLTVGIPNLASLHNRFLLMAGRQPTCIQNHSAHVRGYTRRDFVRTLNTIFPGGYSLQGFGGANFYPFPPAIAKPLARLAPNMAWGIFMLFRKERGYHREFLDYPVNERLETNYYLGVSAKAGEA